MLSRFFTTSAIVFKQLWASEGATLDGNSSATTGSLEVLCPQCLDFRLAFATGALLSPMYRCGRMVVNLDQCRQAAFLEVLPALVNDLR